MQGRLLFEFKARIACLTTKVSARSRLMGRAHPGHEIRCLSPVVQTFRSVFESKQFHLGRFRFTLSLECVVLLTLLYKSFKNCSKTYLLETDRGMRAILLACLPVTAVVYQPAWGPAQPLRLFISRPWIVVYRSGNQTARTIPLFQYVSMLLRQLCSTE